MGYEEDGQEAWQHQLMQERYREACEAINRCVEFGVDPEALKVLARECGVEIKHTKIGAK